MLGFLNTLNLEFKKPNNYLAVLLAGYIFLLFFLSAFGDDDGNFYALNQAILWIGGPGFAVLAIVHYSIRPFVISTELTLYLILILWSLTGLMFAIDMERYFRYLRLMISIAMLWFAVAVVVYRSGNIFMCFLALWVTSLIYVGFSFFGGEVASLESWDRIEGLADNANGFANVCRIGILSGLFLISRKNPLILNIAILATFAMFMQGIVLSASRGNFVNLGLIILSFLVLKFINKKGGMFIVLFMLLLFSYGIYYVITEYLLTSNLLYRFVLLGTETDSLQSSEPRVMLYVKGWQTFLQNPVFGVGMNQFRFYSGGLGAHSDWIDLLATRGIFGFSLYLGIFAGLWRRMSRLKKRFNNHPVYHHRMIVFQVILISQLLGTFTYENHLAINDMCIIAFLASYTWYLKKKELPKQLATDQINPASV